MLCHVTVFVADVNVHIIYEHIMLLPMQKRHLMYIVHKSCVFTNMQIIWQKHFFNQMIAKYLSLLRKDLTLLQLRSSQTKQTIKCLLTAKISLFPNNLLGFFSGTLRPNMLSISPHQYYFALRTYCGLMSHKLFIISRKWGFFGVFFSNIWREMTKKNSEQMLKTYHRPLLISLRFQSVWFGLTGNETVVTAGEIFTLRPPSALPKQ